MVANGGNAGGRSLGSASGSISVDVSQLKSAAAVINQFVVDTAGAFAKINASMNNVAAMSKNATTLLTAQSKQAATEAKAAADVQIAAINAQAKAHSDATKIQIQNMKQLAAQQNAAAGGRGAAGKGGFGGMTMPTFLQFSAFPLAQALSGVGMQGAGNAVMTGGSFVGLADVFTSAGGAARMLADRMKELPGLLGSIATLASNATVGLGATGSALATIGAVLAPIAVLVIGLSVALGNLATSFQEAKERADQYVTRQLEINELIAGGGTSQDLNQRIEEERARRDSAEQMMRFLRPLTDRLATLSQLQTGAIQGAAGGNVLSQLALLIPNQTGLADFNKQIQETTNGQINSVTELYAAYERLQKQFLDASNAVEQLSASAGDVELQANDLAAVLNQVANADVDRAEFIRQASRANSDALEQMIADTQAELVARQAALDMTSGKERENFEARIAQLNFERSVLEDMKVAADRAALGEFTNKLRDLADVTALANRRLAQDRAIAAADQSFDRTLAQARQVEDFTRQRNQKAADFAKSQRRAEEDYLLSRAEAEENYREETLQREAEHQDKLAKIIADARIAILEAASRLDARAVFEEQRRRDAALRDANDSNNKEREARQKRYDEEMEDQAAQYARQRERALEDYQEQIRRDDEERALRAQREQQDYDLQRYRQEQQYALQDQRRQEDQARQIVQMYNQFKGIEMVVDNGMKTITGIFGENITKMVNDVINMRNAWNVSGGAGGGGSGGGGAAVVGGGGGGGGGSAGTGLPILPVLNQTWQHPQTGTWFRWNGNSWVPINTTGGTSGGGWGISSFAVGTPYVPYDMLAMVHQGERIIPAAQNRAGASGTSLQWTGDLVLGDIGDRSDAQVIALVERGLLEVAHRLAGH